MGCYMLIKNPITKRKINLYRSAFKMARLLGLRTHENEEDMGWYKVKGVKIKEVFNNLKNTTDRTTDEENILCKLYDLLSDDTSNTYRVYFDY